MAFKSYLVTELPDGSLALARPEPVRFSGPHGLVARHLAKLDPAEHARWSLDDSGWLLLAGPHPAGETRWIVFEQLEDDTLHLSRVDRINGIVSGGQTELLLMLSPLTVRHPLPALTVIAPPDGKAWSEELALDGAPGRPGAPWCWCERALHVGAAVLGGHPRS